jgi:hypothetical protein
MYTDHTIQALHFVRVYVYNLDPNERPDCQWFDWTYNAIYNFLLTLPDRPLDLERHRRLDLTWGNHSSALRVYT